MAVVDLVYFAAGGGHRAAANALAESIARSGWPWTVRKVHLFEVLDAKGTFRRITGMAPEDYYNKRLAKGWTLGLAQELLLLQGLIRLAHPTLVKRLRRHWEATRPDLVVSLIPNFNRALCESLAAACPGVPYVTVLTDLADYPPHFWIERAQRQHFICGSAHAARQALAAAHDADCVHISSGMVLHPDFHGPRGADRAEARRALGLDAHATAAVVMFGGQGSTAMLSIAAQLDGVQAIFLCGRNARLAARLRALPARAPRAVVEFTPRVWHYMALGDFFIGKPGPGSLSEAVHMGLPVITVRNRMTMPQERWNATWVVEQGVGLVGSSFADLRPLVDALLADLPRYRAAVRAIDNRAVFEVPQILAQIVADGLAAEPLAEAA